MRSLPILGELLYQKITDLTSTSDYNRKNDIIEEISSEVIKEFHSSGLSGSTSDFLLDHGPVIHQKIKDENLKKRNVWVG